MYSFREPQQILHRNMEPQWSPRPRQDTESGLDRLEREEAAYEEQLERIVLPTAPMPLGLTSSTPKPEVKVHVRSKAPVGLNGPTFWGRHRKEVERLALLRSSKVQEHDGDSIEEEGNDSTMDFGRPSFASTVLAGSDDNDDGASGASMDMSRDSVGSTLTLTSPTGRSG
jgi:hypothetical protein